MKQEDIAAIQDEVIRVATEKIQQQRATQQLSRFKMACITVVVCLVLVCATVLGCYAIFQQQQTIREQQYALNLQYSQLSNLLSGAEIVSETTSAEADGDGSIAVAGDGNITAGGDVNGK